MPHFHFHLTMDDDYCPDPIGEHHDDLTAAHSRAVMLANSVMSFCELDGQALRTERGVVTIEDDAGRVLLSVIVPRGGAMRDVRRVVPARRPRWGSRQG
jgi:hypothetical protein